MAEERLSGWGGKADGLRRGADWAAEGRRTRCREEAVGLRREGGHAAERRRLGCGGKTDTLRRGDGWAAIAEEGKGEARELRQKSEMFFYRLYFTSFFVVYVLIMRYIDVVTAVFL